MESVGNRFSSFCLGESSKRDFSRPFKYHVFLRSERRSRKRPRLGRDFGACWLEVSASAAARITTAAEVGSFSITMLSNTNFYPQVTGSANLPATHLLRVKVTTGASGCGTTAAGIVATVTYQMQN